MLLVLIGLWDRYEQETAVLGFRGIYERYLAWQAGLSVGPKGRAAAKAERVRSFEQRPKLVGTGAVGAPTKACPSRCPQTAIRLSWAGLALTTLIVIGRPSSALLGQRGCSHAAAVPGRSRAASWLAPPANTEGDCGPKVHPSPSPPTATPPSLAGLATIEQLGRRGSSPAAAVFGRSKAIS